MPPKRLCYVRSGLPITRAQGGRKKQPGKVEAGDGRSNRQLESDENERNTQPETGAPHPKYLAALREEIRALPLSNISRRRREIFNQEALAANPPRSRSRVRQPTLPLQERWDDLDDVAVEYANDDDDDVFYDSQEDIPNDSYMEREQSLRSEETIREFVNTMDHQVSTRMTSSGTSAENNLTPADSSNFEENARNRTESFATVQENQSTRREISVTATENNNLQESISNDTRSVATVSPSTLHQSTLQRSIFNVPPSNSSPKAQSTANFTPQFPDVYGVPYDQSSQTFQESLEQCRGDSSRPPAPETAATQNFRCPTPQVLPRNRVPRSPNTLETQYQVDCSRLPAPDTAAAQNCHNLTPPVAQQMANAAGRPRNALWTQSHGDSRHLPGPGTHVGPTPPIVARMANDASRPPKASGGQNQGDSGQVQNQNCSTESALVPRMTNDVQTRLPSQRFIRPTTSSQEPNTMAYYHPGLMRKKPAGMCQGPNSGLRMPNRKPKIFSISCCII